MNAHSAVWSSTSALTVSWTMCVLPRSVPSMCLQVSLKCVTMLGAAYLAAGTGTLHEGPLHSVVVHERPDDLLDHVRTAPQRAQHVSAGPLEASIQAQHPQTTLHRRMPGSCRPHQALNCKS